MHEARLDSLARVLVGYCARVKRGDLVTIVSVPEAMPAVEATYRAVILAGGHPSFHVRSERLSNLIVRHGNDSQLRHVCPFERHRLEHCDVLMVLRHQLPPEGADLDPLRVAASQAARKPLITMSLRRKAEGATRYVMTDLPTPAAATAAGMSLDDYTEWFYRAGMLHLADPIAAWRALDTQHQKAIAFLNGKGELRFRAPASDGLGGSRAHDGTDLTVNVEGHPWISCAGGDNFPDGEIYSGPRTANGIVNYSFPSDFRGRTVDGIRLKFRDGRVVEASATRNEDYLIAMLDQDAGARVMGEIAIGTNEHITRSVSNPFFDEKIGGTFHAAVGAGYPETGNTNESGLHWDMVCDLRRGGTIHADGTLFHRDGAFIGM